MNPRPTREDVSRDAISKWKPPAEAEWAFLLGNPDWSFCWVNVAVQGETTVVDEMFASTMARGWVPASPTDIPQFSTPAYKQFVKGNEIRRKGQLLCKMPKSHEADMREYYRREALGSSQNMAQSQLAEGGFIVANRETSVETFNVPR